MLVVVIVLVVLVAAGAGGYFLVLGQSKNSQPNPSAIDLSIVESDPVNQVDSLVPANITATHGTTITIAVQDHDDAARSLVITAFNVNQTIDSGTTQRITLTVGQPGVFQMFVPPRPAANGLKASPAITGYLIVQ
jgi:hypothetical protein